MNTENENTDTDATPETPDAIQPQNVQDATPETPDTDTAEPALKSARRDAAKYRERAHAAEEHAALLETQLTAARRAILKNTQQFGVIDQTAYDDALDQIDVNACYDENGDPVPDQIETALRQLLERKPYMARTRRNEMSQTSKEVDMLRAPHLVGSMKWSEDPLKRALSRR